MCLKRSPCLNGTDLQPIREACEQYWSSIPDLERENELLREQVALLKEKAAMSVPQYVPPQVYGPVLQPYPWQSPSVTYPNVYYGMTDYPMDAYTVPGSMPFATEGE